MKHKMLALVGLFVSLGFLLQILYGCESKDTGTYPVTQIKFYVDDSLYDAVIVRSDRFVMPPAPKKEGYRFEGWFCDKVGFAMRNCPRRSSPNGMYATARVSILKFMPNS